MDRAQQQSATFPAGRALAVLVRRTRNCLYPWLNSILSGMGDMLHDTTLFGKPEASPRERKGVAAVDVFVPFHGVEGRRAQGMKPRARLHGEIARRRHRAGAASTNRTASVISFQPLVNSLVPMLRFHRAGQTSAGIRGCLKSRAPSRSVHRSRNARSRSRRR